MAKALRFLYNKYFIAIAVFLVIMLVFDQNDLITQYKRKQQLKETQKNIDFLKAETERMSAELDELKTNPEVLKKYAREKYYYKSADEDLFIITEDTVYVEKNEDMTK